VIDHVAGMVDLEARLVRTIGDPDIRLREDPVRILRAIKFAARCNLTIEPETYRRMMEHREEITKCAQARVSEEFYRLLRAAAAKRSIELLLETELLDILAPELARALRATDDGEEGVLRRSRLWAYLSALDRQSAKRPSPPSNALILALLVLPPLRDSLDPDSTGTGDVGKTVAVAIAPLLERLKASRRDAELTRQMLLALRYVLPSQRPNRRRPRLADRDFLDDALRLAELVSDAEAAEPAIAGKPLVGTGPIALSEGTDEAHLSDEELAPELAPIDTRGGRYRNRRDRERRPAGSPPREGQPHAAQANPSPTRPSMPSLPASPSPTFASLSSLAAAVLPPLQPERPRFLGTGAFGGPWAVSSYD
jgi:poly(A) polymerase